MTNETSKPDRASVDVHALRARLGGEVVAPGDEGWDEARQAWNLTVDQRPAAVVMAESVDDVVAVVRFAREHDLRVTPQGTGHFAATVGPLHDTILLKTSRMRGVEIDPKAHRARAEAGVIWIEVVEAAAEHGLAALHGSAPDVGVVGYTLGGGMGWLARRYGLAANSVLAIEVVTADGEVVRADRRHHPDLFWALRGGGGSFGIVTAIEFALYPVTEVYAGWLMWPIERSDEILQAWRRWVDTVREDVTSVGRILQLPSIPEIPEPLRGRSFVVVEAACLLSEAEGAELLRPLRELAPEMDTCELVPATALARLHMDPEGPAAGKGDGMLLADLPPRAVEALVEAAGPESGSPLLSVEVRHMGGALSRRSPVHGAVGTFDAQFALFAVGMAITPEMGAAVDAHVHHVRVSMARWEADRTYFNFTERPADAAELFPAETIQRLSRIRAAYDPDERFRATHPVRPSAPAAPVRVAAA